jgi:hypothetical protein
MDTVKKNTETLIDANKEGWSRNKLGENEVYVAISPPECRSKSGNKDGKQIVLNCVTFQMFGNDSNK